MKTLITLLLAFSCYGQDRNPFAPDLNSSYFDQYRNPVVVAPVVVAPASNEYLGALAQHQRIDDAIQLRDSGLSLVEKILLTPPGQIILPPRYEIPASRPYYPNFPGVPGYRPPCPVGHHDY